MATGKVYLVGGGPGDPGLISLRGVECLKLADEVLYDGLVNPLLLRHANAYCERTCRTDGPNGRILKQDEINQRLVDSALAGKTVVRLKGGDPFIFGRGSEEAACLRKHGIDYEIVPGITAATAAGEYAGFSLTHRESASMVTFVTGHEAPDKEGSALNYAQLAASPGTLVFYMGLDNLPRISQSLLDNGKRADTPTAVISRATTPQQRTVVAPLNEISDAVINARLQAPSLIIVGDCIAQRDELKWFEDKPLFGQKIGITRPSDQAEPQVQRAFQLGAQPVLMPAIRIEPIDDWSEVDATLRRLNEFDWLVFTSINGVEAFLDRLWETGGDTRQFSGLKIATIGSSTAESLAKYHLRADLVPDKFRAEALAKVMAPHVAGQNVLWARASRGRDVLPQELTKAGATVTELVVYQNLDAESFSEDALTALENSQLDWIGLSSPSIARRMADLLPDSAKAQLGKTLRIASISPVTSAAAKDAGLPINAEATTYTWDGIFEAIQTAPPTEKSADAE
ncbi:MAG: uroporphyrinogen-III C-methyltransferase [Planctomycetaceae bacterium]|jgi:uroporphyrinogen III methyltransferase/synthase|nr:uroporphyrinogen-III C-methyltransferase [Planctomycetaceae bacterium]